ncbi:N-acetyl-gamma-glutamyl-phosphate reductase [Thalassotalea agarivorans]|uniref:N-acetyl-gamma-glutamyl-phosphate reductase n=2 Tax=Thalassotalea agarivorans TaxID=349064 RepID=A0A1I0CFQ8_THASX|nr:N-acetyl-gamma-glutamyl-phosphate reductase [Thalassotalea agarivorans]
MKVAVIGASGYVGAELIGLLIQHPKVELTHLLVSENSDSCGLHFSELHARWLGICDVPLQSFSQAWFEQSVDQLDAVFFATPHEFSAQWGASFVAKGVKVFDLSGAFRLKDATQYPTFYGFSHGDGKALASAVYGLAEWNAQQIADANLVAVPGCYPTASLTALKPLVSNNLHLPGAVISVNGISGVSGAGRKASLATSFNEVSLSPYNILVHRHQPEISQEASTQVIFNPHLAPYKRGLMATVTVPLAEGVTAAQVDDAFNQAYCDSAIVRMPKAWPKIDNVAFSPFADVHWQTDEKLGVTVISCAIDNLLKGAASQAVQCFNLVIGEDSHFTLLPGGQHV